MPQPKDHFQVALEIGQKRVIASAIAWPGWARVGKDEASALAALLDYGSRYQRAIGSAKLGFHAPTDAASFDVTERLTGDATTDFGAPSIAPSADSAPLDDATLKRLQSILTACWETLETTVKAAHGKQLRKGPRGGGRDVAQLVDHVVEAHYAYLRKIFWQGTRETRIDAIKQIDAQAIAFAASGEMPATGPRGGALWQPRYFVRRAAWHILDHAWEIEDKL